MTDSSSCPQCGAAVSSDSASPSAACAQCGTPLSAMPPPAASMPPPPMTTTLPPPPPPLPTMAVADALPYGKLQQAVVYMGMTQTLRKIGLGHIIFGVFLVAIGAILAFNGREFLGIPSTVMMAIYGVLGMMFLAEGIWLTVAPSAVGLLVAAISLFVAAVFFCNGIILLIILICYGIVLIKRYQKYGPLMAQLPAPAMQAQATDILTKLTKARRKKSPDLIEFSASDALARRLWRGLLQEDMVILIALESRLFGKSIAEVYFLPTGGLQIDLGRRELLGKWLKATFHIADLTVKGTIHPECYRRFEAWQNHMHGPVM